MPQAKVISNKDGADAKDDLLKELDDLEPNSNAADPDEEDDEDQSSDDGADDSNSDSDDDSGSDDADDSADSDDNSDDEGKKTVTDTGKSDDGKKDDDFKKKFADSTAEAQVLALRNKKYEERIQEARVSPAPTDEECRDAYGADWDKSSDMQKSIARDALHNKRKMSLIEKIDEDVQKEKERLETAKTYAIDPEVLKTYPGLEGHQEEFARFVSQPTRRAIELEDLVPVFVANRIARGQMKGSLFPSARTNSVKTPVKKQSVVNANQAATLRKTDSRAYQNLIQSGKIKPADLLDD